MKGWLAQRMPRTRRAAVPIAATLVVPSRRIYVYDRDGHIVERFSGLEVEVKDLVLAELGGRSDFFFFRIWADWTKSPRREPLSDSTTGDRIPIDYIWTIRATEYRSDEWFAETAVGQPAGEQTWVRENADLLEFEPDDVWLVICDVVTGRRRSFIAHGPAESAERAP
jgi:hypothetical protein